MYLVASMAMFGICYPLSVNDTRGQLARCHADAIAILQHLNLCVGDLCQACLTQE